MNLFQKYGIKEVADVVFYSILNVGDEIIYTPVLYLDTLKVSTIEKTGQKVNAEGGKGNKKLVSWKFGKEISLSLEDALFTPASMSMLMGGLLKSELSIYSSIVVKSNIANKYGKNHYSIKAYASPVISEDEWKIVFKAATEEQVVVDGKKGDDSCWYIINNEAVADEDKKAYIKENQTLLKRAYTYRTWGNEETAAMPENVIEKVLSYIDDLKKLGTIETKNYDLECIDRYERCTVRDKKGLSISTDEQKRNLLRYYADDKSSSYTIYYDIKTMLPLLHIEDGKIKGWTHTIDQEGVDSGDTVFTLKPGTGYLKWTRTVKPIDGADDSVLGNTLVIDSETFSGDYKIVCETYIRNQKTGKDQRYQIVINRAQINDETNITLQADGDPTTFSMKIDVLAPQNGDLMELRQFNVTEDELHGGTRIVPQNSQHTYTNSFITEQQINNEDINNGEII